MSTNEPRHVHVPDIASSTFKADPLPASALLRAELPVARVSVPGIPGDSFLITRYEDAAAVLRDERFVKDVRGARDAGDLRQQWMPRALQPLAHTMLDSDGEEHRRLRGLVRDTFTPRYVAALEPRAQEIADDLLERMAAKRKADLVADYALLLPLTLISEILGVAQRDRLRFRRWLHSLIAASSSGGASLRVLLKLPDILAMMRFLRRLVAERREEPRDDLVSRLAAAGEGGDRLNENELLAMVALLLIAGYETTVNLIATGTLLLLTHPDQLTRLRQDPILLGTAVEELLRLGSPIDVATERYARETAEVAGTVIPRGSLVLVGIVSANADGERFPEPERLDLGREDNHHVAFGLGPHYCLGAPLARL
ncbi:MAG: cytochrome P450, partial [Candidatus Dormibacteraeota bacterium]|nr:cytochrome P450 [Candidatus Dormibacteraeota bacterium]